MNTQFYAFGEILWDCLPSGRHAGGAPFNVCAHLAQLGASASLISAVGQDALGDEILQAAQDKGIHTQFVHRARAGLATGTVQVTLDAHANATYEIVEPVAWDEIEVPPEALQAIAQARALVFGSLAGRSAYNLIQLGRLLDVPGPLKFFDVNLRPPFADPALVIGLAKRADVVKLNDDELLVLAGWVETQETPKQVPRTTQAIPEACAALARATETSCIYVTRGAQGAALWNQGVFVSVPAPRVAVKDTIGAGDAFVAGLILGLTQGADRQRTLERACRLGAYVASHNGATPLLPPEIIQDFKTN